MSAAIQTRPSNKKSKKRFNVGTKENKESVVEMNTVKETTSPSNKNLSSNVIPTSTSPATLTKLVNTENPLNDPAIVAAGRPRRQPLRKKSDLTNVLNNSTPTPGKGDAEKVDTKPASMTTVTNSKPLVSEKAVPRAPRAMRRGRASHQSSTAKTTPKATNEEDESVVCAPKLTLKREKGSVPTAATPPRFQSTAKIRRDRADSLSTRANESMESEHQDEKSRTVRFTTDLSQAGSTKQTSGTIDMDAAKTFVQQQAALNDAAVLLAQSALPGFYPNFLASSNLAQQQLASAQVLAQLRASVEGFKALRNFSVEPAAAYDASRVPCLGDREDVNTTTNIYVNNLPSHTSDDDLLRLGACFGPVKSHKAIINQDTGLCKGYGFVMYEHAHDAETALHQLPLHGLTTSWAKESFSTKLRKLSDNTTSNVYVSNLPMDMSPHQLEQLFAPHLVVSLRILLDDNGASRGVGFVRLRDRDTAQECIDKLHGKVLTGQTTPLQARFADSEAQKRLKQSVNQVPSNAKPTTPLKATTTTSNGLLDSTSGLADPMYLASLQGLQNWAGFGTPQNNNGGAAFVSPTIGMTSPAVNYAQWSPSMAATANWNLLNSEVYGNALLSGGGNNGGFGLNYANSIYSPSSMATSLNSPFAQYSNKSLSPLSFASTPLSGMSPVLGKGVDNSGRGSSNIRNSKPTYLPPDVHQQHAKALLEAQAGLTFDSPQAEAFGLSQLLLNSNATEFYQQQFNENPMLFSSGNPYAGLVPSQLLRSQQQQQSVATSTTTTPSHHHNTETMQNALGMSGMASKDLIDSSTIQAKKSSTFTHTPKNSIVPLALCTPSHNKISTVARGGGPTGITLSPIRFSLSTDPENPITVEAVDGDYKEEEVKAPTRVSTPMPGTNAIVEQGAAAVMHSAGIDSVTEEGDSLVIDSGTGSAVGSFSSQGGGETKQEVVVMARLPKSDSGKVLDEECCKKEKMGKSSIEEGVVEGIEVPLSQVIPVYEAISISTSKAVEETV